MIRGKLIGSLAFRVLFSSVVFIVTPLIFYALFIYQRDYQQRLDDIFEEMHLFQKDQAFFIKQFEETNRNFLTVIHEFIVMIQDQTGTASLDKIDIILHRYTSKENLNANFYLTVNKNNELICTSSSLKEYENVNFSPYFSLDDLKALSRNIFVAKDPIFGYSLFVVSPVKNHLGSIEGVACVSIALHRLVYALNTAKNPYDPTVSIMNSEGRILASTAPKRVDKTLIKTPHLTTKNSSDIIHYKQIPSVDKGFETYINDQKRFLTFIDLPGTDTKIVLTIPANVLLTTLYKSLTEFASLLMVIIAFGGIISYLLTLRFAKPMSQLASVMEAIGSGHLETRFKRDPMGFEINYLGERFNDMALSLTNYIEEVKTERAFKEAYQKELQIGREIQASLLPEKAIDFFELQSAVYFEPAKEVAGDFYDWLIKGDHLFITIADGVGKGISGCLYAFTLKSTLKTAETIFDDLGEIATKTNRIFCEDTKETGSFVTAFLAKYHGPTKTLSYTNCGHNYPIIKRATGYVERLETQGIAFGALLFETIEVKTTTLLPGDFVIFYTDGLTDAQDPTHKLFSEKRLLQLIETSTYTTPQELLSLINKEIALFTKGEPQYDDITLLILKV